MILYILAEVILTGHKHSKVSYLATRRQSEALGSATAAVLGTGTQTSLGETLPELTLVVTAGQSGIGINDSITSLNHVGVTRLTTES
jgi:hypothetical protein